MFCSCLGSTDYLSGISPFFEIILCFSSGGKIFVFLIFSNFCHVLHFKALLKFCKSHMLSKKSTTKQFPILVFCPSTLPAFLFTFNLQFLCSCCLLSYFHVSSFLVSFFPSLFLHSFLPSLFQLFLFIFCYSACSFSSLFFLQGKQAP